MRIAFINAGMYHEEHPLVAKSIDALSDTLHEVLKDQMSVEIGFTSEHIMVGTEEFKGDRLYEEEARYFHIRKVKSIRISTGVDTSELALFVKELSASPRALDEAGGLKVFIEKNDLPHIHISALDYSPFLGSSGQEISEDVWNYLLGEVGTLQTQEDTNGFISRLTQAIEQMNFHELKSDSEDFLRLQDIVGQLKEKMPDVSQSLGKEVLKAVLKKQEQIQDEKVLEQVRSLFSRLSRKSQIDTLWNEVFGSKSFNPVIFSVFDRLVEKDNKEEYLQEWDQKLKDHTELVNDPHLRERVKNMLVMEETNVYMPQMYRYTLTLLSSRIGVDLKMMLNKNALFRNYLFALLNLLSWEGHCESIIPLCDELLKNTEEVSHVHQIELLRQFHQALSMKLVHLDDARIKEEIRQREGVLLTKIEEVIVEGTITIDEDTFEYFIGILERSQFSSDLYFKKIFGLHPRRQHVVRLFLKFFPHLNNAFLEQLKKESTNVGFLKEVIEALNKVDTRQVYSILKNIFLTANPLVKIEVLKAMQNSSYVEDDFVLENLRQDNVFLKKELVAIVKKKTPEVQKKAGELLLSVFNLFGINNRILLENIRLIRDAQLASSREKLADLLKWFLCWGGTPLKTEIERTLSEFRKL